MKQGRTFKTAAVVFALCMAMALLSCNLTIGTSLGAHKIEASRTEGVAPLFVHFSSGAMTTEDDSAQFLQNEYSWDFGDPESGTWGTDGKSRNQAKGGITGHLFERPGRYTVTLTVRTRAGYSSGGRIVITVQDPDEVYAGEKTVCVSDIDDFAGAPPGSRHVVSTDLSEIAALATAGTRILFRRGGQWTAGNVGGSWPQNEGPVTIGAYGAGVNPDALGIYQNAPKISLTGNAGTFFSLNGKRDWRVMDLWFDEPSGIRASTNGIDASYEFRDILALRMRVSGFNYGICWSHWNRDPVITIERNAIVSCYIHDQDEYGIYAGSERLAVMGNLVRDVQDEHVMRIWQAWHSVISHNLLSGASLDGVKGDHAMKLHGPGIGPDNCLGPAVPNTYMLEKRTDYVVVSDNAFGSSGPWPVMICPTNQGQDENLSNIVFERNRLSAQFGTQLTPVQVSLKVAANRVSIRNNVIDATGAHTEWVGIDLTRHGVEPKPTRIAVYNNTIYRADDPEGGFRFGIRVHEEASDVVIANNLVSCASSFLPVEAVHDSSGMAQRSATVVIKDPKFADPTNADPLQRDFSLLPGSPALGAGVFVPVWEDFTGAERPRGGWDLGAMESR